MFQIAYFSTWMGRVDSVLVHSSWLITDVLIYRISVTDMDWMAAASSVFSPLC